jgi:hypothetical protein
MNSAKKLLLARIQATLEALRVPWSLKSIQRRRSIDSKPTHDRCLDFIVGDEDVVAQDNRGYVIEFPINLRLTWRASKNGFDLVEDLKAAVQAALEADPQFTSLATNCIYNGEVDLSGDDTWSQGTCLLAYTVQYRRVRANPYQSY